MFTVCLLFQHDVSQSGHKQKLVGSLKLEIPLADAQITVSKYCFMFYLDMSSAGSIEFASLFAAVFR